MFLRRLVLRSIILLFPIAIYAASEQPVEWSYLYLSRAANFLMVAADSDQKVSATLCGIDSKKALLLNPFIRALLDDKKNKIQTAPFKDKIKHQIENCAASCTCGYYADLVANSDSSLNLSLNKSASEMTGQVKLKCAQSFKDFCQSELLKFLFLQVSKNQ